MTYISNNKRLFAHHTLSITLWKTTTSYGLFFCRLKLYFAETLSGFVARAAFPVNSATVFRGDIDMPQTIVDDKIAYLS